jgi:hypothetical protein
MKLAKVVFPQHSLPALCVFAIFLSVFLMWAADTGLTRPVTGGGRGAPLEPMVGVVLSEVETLSRVDLTANRHLEVFIGNFAIFI